MSIVPYSSNIVLNIASTCSSLLTSALTAIALPFERFIFSTTCFASSSLNE